MKRIKDDEKFIKKFLSESQPKMLSILKDYKESSDNQEEVAKLFLLNLMGIDIKGKKQISLISDDCMKDDYALWNAINDIIHLFLKLETNDLVGVGFFFHSFPGFINSIVKAKDDFIKMLEDNKETKEPEHKLLN